MKKSISIENWFNKKNRCLVVAEAGCNHNGDVQLAKKLIEAAKECGCGAVKFQAFTAEDLVSKKAEKADYQKGKSQGVSQLAMLKALQLSKVVHKQLIEHAKKVDIAIFYSVFDYKSADLIDKLGVDLFKLGSGELTNIPLIDYVARKGKPLIISTGMASDGEIAEAVSAIHKIPKAQFMLMHCSTGYPSRLEDANLRRMKYLEDKFSVSCGNSDHTKGIIVSVIAAALGAPMIEKHFTLDKKLNGPDHPMSMEPHDMKELCVKVAAIKQTVSESDLPVVLNKLGIKIVNDELEVILGRGNRSLSSLEEKQRVWARKSVVAAKNIKKGEFFSDKNLAIKRPEKGIFPKDKDKLLGRKANCLISEGTPIEWSMVN